MTTKTHMTLERGVLFLEDGTEVSNVSIEMIERAPYLVKSLTKLLDWAREHTSPTQENSPHEILVEAHNLLAEINRDNDGLDEAVRSVVEPPRITAIDRVISCGSCALTGLFNDGSTKSLFSYYIDELTICDAHLIGLTEAEACQLFLDRDTSYLRS